MTTPDESDTKPLVGFHFSRDYPNVVENTNVSKYSSHRALAKEDFVFLPVGIRRSAQDQSNSFKILCKANSLKYILCENKTLILCL
jgi:hypothetical protein